MIVTILYFLIFIFLIFWFLYAVGFFIISYAKTKIENQEIIALSLSLGVVLFVLLTVVLGLLNFRNLMLPAILLTDIYVVVKFRERILEPWKIFWQDKILSGLIIMGILIQGFINFPSGFLYKAGLLFWSSQGHDGLWHVALIEEIKKTFPPQNPIFSGFPLFNYHYLVDILMGEFYRNFPFLSALDLYFRFFPVLFSLMIGISVFAFVARWQKDVKVGYLAVFFTYFVGSFGYFVTYFKNGNFFGGETVFWASQLNSILGNPPHAISISLMTTFFLSFYLLVKERNRFWFIISLILAGNIAGFKVSAGMTLLAGLGLAALVDLIFNRRKEILLLCGVLGFTNILTVLQMTRSAGSFFIFLPWWYIRTMIVVRLDWIDLELRRQYYLSLGTWRGYLRVGQLELTAFLIFLIGNLGMRFVGFYELVRKMLINRFAEFKNPVETLLFASMATGFMVPLIFLQKGVVYNSIQFFQYFLLIFGFYGAVSVYKIMHISRNLFFKATILSILIILSVPTVIGNLVEFYSRPPLAKISNAQIQALDYLKQNSDPDSIVLAVPLNKDLHSKYSSQPWPIYAWYSTSYIPAIASRRTYLSSEEQAVITDYPEPERLAKEKEFFAQIDSSQNQHFLKEENIAYIFVNKDELEKQLDKDKNNLKVFFENNEVVIYEVK